MVEAMAIANAYMKYRFRMKMSRLAPGSPNIQRNLAVRFIEEYLLYAVSHGVFGCWALKYMYM